jgi:hypothetical protein
MLVETRFDLIAPSEFLTGVADPRGPNLTTSALAS